MKVKNLQGTANRTPPRSYSSWLDYYMRQRRLSSTPQCAACGCSHSAEVGAHVIKAGSPDRSWHIVPLCSRCNMRDDEFEVKSSTPPLPVYP